MTGAGNESGAVVWSRDLPEPTRCVIDEDEGCTNDEQECTCKWFCGDPGEAGCCYCDHSDVYAPCPRGGFWCEGDCNNGDEDCCEPHEKAFALAAYFARELDRLVSAPSPSGDGSAL